MLVRDVLPPQKIKRIAREELLGMKAYKDKKSRYFHLSLRAVVFCVLIFTIFPFFSSQAEDEGILEAAQESLEEITSSVGELSASIGEGIASGIEDLGSNIGEILGIPEDPAEAEKFEDLPLEQAPVSQGQPAGEVPQSFSSSETKMTKLEKTIVNGREKFITRNPQGEEAGFFDADETSDTPYLRLGKWEGRADLKIKLPQATGGAKHLDGDRLKIKNGDKGVEIYPKPAQTITESIAGVPYVFTVNSEGGVEFDVVLDKVPENNFFDFPVESEGLRFYYQPPLHPEHPTWADEDGDGIADHFRPEMAVGSYAVYYEAQEGLFKTEEEGEKYKTGKAFHVYRPQVSDAAGNSVWGDLSFDEATRVLRVAVDPAWLAAAAYPVRIDPNLGYDTQGASSTSLTDQIRSTFPATAAADSMVIEVNAYMRAAGGLGYAAKGNVYNSSYGRLSSGGTIGMDVYTSADWYGEPYIIPPAITSGSSYYATIWVDNATYLYYDTAASTTILSQGLAYGSAWPNPASTASSTAKYSIYATYGSSSGSRASGVGISGGGFLMF